MFSIPSTLYNLCEKARAFIGSLSHLAYDRFIKFSVASKSTNAMFLALLAIVWGKTQTVMDFLADMYTSLLLFCLISATLIRQWENPYLLPLPFPGLIAPFRLQLGC
jgi:hypothetical protein